MSKGEHGDSTCTKRLKTACKDGEEQAGEEEKEEESRRSIERLGDDTLQWCILIYLDARSLARCRMVSRAWNFLASADLLWLPLCCYLFTLRAQLPLAMLNLNRSIPSYSAYNLTMDDARKSRLLSKEMCARTWELSVKPTCGQYWLSLDPSTRGEPALARFFHCDGSLTAEPNDPIWGGQESYWRFIFADTDQYIKINYWPMFNILRLNDGRWRLENKWATYTTQPDLHIGTGISMCKEPAPPCSACSYPRLKNARTKLMRRENIFHEFLRSVSRSKKLSSRLLLDGVNQREKE